MNNLFKMSNDEVQPELDRIRLAEQARILAPKTALADELRRLTGQNGAFDLSEASDRIVEQLKLAVAQNIHEMKQVASTGQKEYHIQIFIAYTRQTLDVYKEAVSEMNKKKYYGLSYRIEAAPGVFVVWAAWL
jgi:hypothetical protein